VLSGGLGLSAARVVAAVARILIAQYVLCDCAIVCCIATVDDFCISDCSGVQARKPASCGRPTVGLLLEYMPVLPSRLRCKPPPDTVQIKNAFSRLPLALQSSHHALSPQRGPC
jgi:hypothetical protein